MYPTDARWPVATNLLTHFDQLFVLSEVSVVCSFAPPNMDKKCPFWACSKWTTNKWETLGVTTTSQVPLVHHATQSRLVLHNAGQDQEKNYPLENYFSAFRSYCPRTSIGSRFTLNILDCIDIAKYLLKYLKVFFRGLKLVVNLRPWSAAPNQC